MKWTYAAVAAAAITTGSNAHAADVTFTWDYVGTLTASPAPTCIYFNTCYPTTIDNAGTYQVTLPDDTTANTTTPYYEFGTYTTSFTTRNGQLISFDQVLVITGTENYRTHYSLTNAGGYSWGEGFVNEGEGFSREIRTYYLPGTTPPAVAPVPEPSSALLIVAGIAMLATRRKTKA